MAAPGRHLADLRAEFARPDAAAVYGVVPVVAAAMWVMGRLDLIADVPFLLMLALLLGSAIAGTLGAIRWRANPTTANLHLRIAAQAAGTTAVAYATGWGPMLNIGYVFQAYDGFGAAGSAAAGPATLWAMIGMACGQLAIQLGVAPSYVDPPGVHGLAALAALGLVLVIRMIGRTVAEQEEAQAAIKLSEERFRSLVQNSSDVITVVDIDGSITYVSPSMQTLLGYTPEEFIAGGGLTMLHPEDLSRAQQMFSDVLASPDEIFRVEVRAQHREGHWVWSDVTTVNLITDPAVQGVVSNIHDVTERKLLEERLAYGAFHDSLTGLPNRAAFNDSLDRALARARRRKQPLAVMFLDLDRFKLVNDSMGHEVGDRLLVEASARLQSAVRPGDTVARFAGDEFTILLEDIDDASSATAVADRVIAAMAQPITLMGHEMVVPASVGIVVSSGEEATSDSLLREADLAMYLAKEKGRARWELFDLETAPHLQQRLDLEARLWRAVEGDEFGVWFQPEVELATGAIVGAEALVRWHHPERGTVLPGAFIPVAEESDLVVAIDRQVLLKACAAAQAWPPGDGPPPTVSVNLSLRWFRQPEPVQAVMDALAGSGLSADRLQLEITERLAFAEEDSAIAALKRLRAAGVRIAIDDFGTGYSSLGYLRQFPVDVVKLDRAFVDRADSASAEAAIVQAVISLGHALGMKVTAEGVERPEQLARLRMLGCDTAQGLHFAPAMPPAEFAHLLAGSGAAGERGLSPGA